MFFFLTVNFPKEKSSIYHLDRRSLCKCRSVEWGAPSVSLMAVSMMESRAESPSPLGLVPSVNTAYLACTALVLSFVLLPVCESSSRGYSPSIPLVSARSRTHLREVRPSRPPSPRRDRGDLARLPARTSGNNGGGGGGDEGRATTFRVVAGSTPAERGWGHRMLLTGCFLSVLSCPGSLRTDAALTTYHAI